MSLTDKNIYYSKHNGFWVYFNLLVISLLIFLMSTITVSVLFDSNVLGIVAGFLFVLLYLFGQTNNSTLATIIFSSKGVEIDFPFSVYKKKEEVGYSDVSCVYFQSGMTTRKPFIVMNYKSHKKKNVVYFQISTPSTIELFLKNIESHVVNTGISAESSNYYGIKDKFKVINPEKLNLI